MNYCPVCCSLDVALNGPSGRCLKCGFEGELRSGAMDDINLYRRGIKNRTLFDQTIAAQLKDSPRPTEEHVQMQTVNPLKANLERLKGTVTNDFEIM